MRSRLFVLLTFVLVWVCVVGGRLYGLQVERHEHFLERAQRQQRAVIELQPPRGTIFDAGGRELAVSRKVDSAFARPGQIEDPAATARALASVLGIDAGKLAAQLQSKAGFVWVERQLDEPAAEALRALDLPGIGFVPESKRYYPQRQLAAPVLGFVGLDDQGLRGLEALYQETLLGPPVEQRMLRDARRGKILYSDLSFLQVAPGDDIVLTIDSSVQYILERELAAGLARHRGKSATGVVLDPDTGAILAMSSLPAFDPNRYAEERPEHWRNRAVEDAFEPGSTFKLMTAAAAFEANLVDPLDVFDCENGSIVLSGVRINDHRSFGKLTFRDVIAYSSNVGAIKTGLLVGARALHDQATAFGFGSRTGVDMPAENRGLVRPLEQWQRRSVAYISFGQEISVTALQLANAFAAIGNGGTLYRPFVVREVVGEGRREVRRPEVVGHPISESTARTLERLLEAVVTDGTGRLAAIPGYSVAGKTGTAEKALPGRGYVAGRYVASFVGFAPARHPRVVCLIVVDEPQGAAYHGGDVAAGVFSKAVTQILLHLRVPPDRRPDAERALVASRLDGSPTTG